MDLNDITNGFADFAITHRTLTILVIVPLMIFYTFLLFVVFWLPVLLDLYRRPIIKDVGIRFLSVWVAMGVLFVCAFIGVEALIMAVTCTKGYGLFLSFALPFVSLIIGLLIVRPIGIRLRFALSRMLL